MEWTLTDEEIDAAEAALEALDTAVGDMRQAIAELRLALERED